MSEKVSVTMFSRILAALFLSLTVLFLNPASEAKTWKTVRVGIDENYPPFSFRNPAGKLDGFDYLLAEALCKKMGVDCEFYYISFDETNLALNGQRDISAPAPDVYKQKPVVDVLINSMTITEERKRFFAFSKPYYYVPHGILIRKDSGISIKGSKDTAGLKVGVAADSEDETYARKYFRQASLKTFYDTDAVKQALQSREIDLGLVDAVTAYEWVDTDAGSCCKTDGYFSAHRDLSQGVGMAVRRADTELLEMLNASLTLLKNDGTYDALRQKFFKFKLDAK